MPRLASSAIFVHVLLYYFLIERLCSGNPLDNYDIDICEFVNGQQIYCNCDNQGVDEAKQVTCFIVILDGLTPSASVWDGFGRQKRITSLLFTSRLDTKLTYLPVNALKHISDSLETLTINEANLGILGNNSIANFSKLSKISLERNEITHLSESAFVHLPSLTSLGLSENMIDTLKANVLVDLPKLDELILDRNRITGINDYAFSHLKQLREIDLRLNQIEVISQLTFWGLNNLKRLDLSRNKLRIIPNYAFTGAPRLRELDLNQNQIDTVQDNAFHNMSHLMSLQLNNNHIKILPSGVFKGSPQLVLIDLSGNNLETIEKNNVDSLEHLQKEQFVIYLKDNPFECDCRLIWLSNMSRTAVSIVFKRELRQIRCSVKEKFDDLTIGEHYKVIRLGQNESFVKSCNRKSSAANVIPSSTVINSSEDTDRHRESVTSETLSENKKVNNKSIDNNRLDRSEEQDRSSQENDDSAMVTENTKKHHVITSTDESFSKKFSDVFDVRNEINDAVPNAVSEQKDGKSNKSNNKDDATVNHLSIWLITLSIATILIYK